MAVPQEMKMGAFESAPDNGVVVDDEYLRGTGLFGFHGCTGRVFALLPGSLRMTADPGTATRSAGSRIISGVDRMAAGCGARRGRRPGPWTPARSR